MSQWQRFISLVNKGTRSPVILAQRILEKTGVSIVRGRRYGGSELAAGDPAHARVGRGGCDFGGARTPDRVHLRRWEKGRLHWINFCSLTSVRINSKLGVKEDTPPRDWDSLGWAGDTTPAQRDRRDTSWCFAHVQVPGNSKTPPHLELTGRSVQGGTGRSLDSWSPRSQA